MVKDRYSREVCNNSTYLPPLLDEVAPPTQLRERPTLFDSVAKKIFSISYQLSTFVTLILVKNAAQTGDHVYGQFLT